MNNAGIDKALETIHTRLANEDVRWALVGTANHALNGIDVVPGDIDIIADRESAYKIASLLEDYVVARVEYTQTKSIRSHLGEFLVHGVKVEVMGEMWRKVGQEWTNLSEWVLTSPATVRLGEMSFPSCPLDKELIAYELSGREEDAGKAEKIRNTLRAQAQQNSPVPTTGKTRVQSIVIQNGQVLFGHGKGYHFFIGGGLEEGETPEQGALRELREEANVEGTVVFRINEPKLGVLVGPNSFYQSHVTFLVDIGEQTPTLGYDPEETDTGDEVGLAGLQTVPLSDMEAFTWIDIRYFSALRLECTRRDTDFPWLEQLNDLLKIWRVK